MSLSPFPIGQVPSELTRLIIKKRILCRDAHIKWPFDAVLSPCRCRLVDVYVDSKDGRRVENNKGCSTEFTEIFQLEPLEYGRLFRSCHSMRDICNGCSDIALTVKQAVIHVLPDKMIISIPPYILECDPEKNNFRPFDFIVDELEIGIYVVPISVKKLTKLIRQIKITCSSLTICGTVSYNAQEMRELLELTRSTSLSLLGHPVMKQFSPFETMNKMAAIQFQSSDYGDEEVLALKAENIEINCCGMTNLGVNQLLKQWLWDERSINSVVLYGEVTFSVDEIIEDLPVSLLYDAAHHQFSIFKGLRQPPGKIQDASIYILIKSHDISQKLLLIIRKDEIQCCRCQEPVETFLVYLAKSVSPF